MHLYKMQFFHPTGGWSDISDRYEAEAESIREFLLLFEYLCRPLNPESEATFRVVKKKGDIWRSMIVGNLYYIYEIYGSIDSERIIQIET